MSAALVEEGAPQTIRAQAVTSSRGMQHAGTWLMIAMLHRLGLYAAAEEASANANARKTLRIALDAFVCALATGEGCVEGMRRLMTPSGGALLRANRVSSATWGSWRQRENQEPESPSDESPRPKPRARLPKRRRAR